MQRREFLKTVGAASTGAVVMGGSALRAQNRETPTQSALIMDAMGEIRVTHTRTLLKQVINSGTNAVTVTLCDPKHQEDEARKVALAGLLDYDRHIKKNADLLIKATSVADMDQA
ncbi:hypothetical protein MJD09_25640, partial [bacterium]|nr:hypothetical protein [bacterium]